MGLGRKVGGADLHDTLEMGAERERRPQQVLCYGAGTQTLGFLTKSIHQADEIHFKLFNDVLIMTKC